MTPSRLFFYLGLSSLVLSCAHYGSSGMTDLSNKAQSEEEAEHVQEAEDSLDLQAQNTVISSKQNLSDQESTVVREQLMKSNEVLRTKSNKELAPKKESVSSSTEVLFSEVLDADFAVAEAAEAIPSQSAAVFGLLGAKGDSKGVGGLGSRGRSAPSSYAHGTLGGLPVDEPNQHVNNRVLSQEEYTDYGVNPFIEQAKDALSTFSIDVDTASYTIARRKLKGGTLPPAASVRVEEFINYFDYAYDASEAAPFTVHMDGMQNPFAQDKHVLRVGVQGKEFTEQSRPPLHLTFLVDVSGSMSSADKLPLAQKAMHKLVNTLREDDTVALTTYAGSVRAVLEPTSGAQKNEIHKAIDLLSSGGSTAMSSGLDLAYKMAWSTFEEGAENRVVVLSDGDANVGRVSWPQMLQQIKGYADRGVTMSTIGFGMGNYKDTRMEQLANKGDGNNYYIDSEQQAEKVFVEDFNSTMISIARDVKIQVDFDSSVHSYRLIGYENRDIADKDFRNDRVDAGEVGAGHNVTALYEVILADGARSRDSLATVRLRYEAPGADKAATERSWTVDVGDIQSSPSKDLRLAYTAGTFAEILRQSPHTTHIELAELIRYGSPAKQLESASELINLMTKAKDLGVGQAVSSR